MKIIDELRNTIDEMFKEHGYKGDHDKLKQGMLSVCIAAATMAIHDEEGAAEITEAFKVIEAYQKLHKKVV